MAQAKVRICDGEKMTEIAFLRMREESACQINIVVSSGSTPRLGVTGKADLAIDVRGIVELRLYSSDRL
jgi:hypothetical protein